MKPLRFASGEVFRDLLQDDPALCRRYAFDHLHLEPVLDFQYRLSAKLPKGEYPETGAFGNGALLKSIGNFGININKALDKTNQIAIHIPDPRGRTVFVHGNNILTLNHVRESIEAILDSYVENRDNKNFNLHAVAAPQITRARKFLDCMMAFASAVIPVEPQASLNNYPLPSDTIIDRYLAGVDLDRLTTPLSNISYDSFDLDYGYKDTRQHVFEISEENNFRSNMPNYDDEKQDSQESMKAFDPYWNLHFFEGGKALYFRRLKSFIQSELGVTVSISEYSTCRIELRGTEENVRLAKRIGIRAVPLLNEGAPLPEKDGKPGKPLDKEWLENALSDARHYFAVKNISQKLGVTPPPIKTISRKAEPCEYPDFHLPGFIPA